MQNSSEFILERTLSGMNSATLKTLKPITVHLFIPTLGVMPTPQMKDEILAMGERDFEIIIKRVKRYIEGEIQLDADELPEEFLALFSSLDPDIWPLLQPYLDGILTYDDEEDSEENKFIKILNGFNMYCLSMAMDRVQRLGLTPQMINDRITILEYYIGRGYFTTVNYLMDNDPQYTKTMLELLNIAFKSSNISLLNWCLRNREEDIILQVLKNYKEDAGTAYSHAFKEAIFKALGYTINESGDQLACLKCPDEQKEQIVYLASITGCEIIPTFEFVKAGFSPERELILRHNLSELFPYFTPKQQLPLQHPQGFFQKSINSSADLEKAHAFAWNVAIFNEEEKIGFQRELMKIRKEDPNTSMQTGLEIMQDLAEHSFGGAEQAMISHLQDGNIHTFEYLFFHTIIRNDIDILTKLLPLLKHEHWYLSRDNVKFKASIEILMGNEGEEACFKIYEVLDHFFIKNQLGMGLH